LKFLGTVINSNKKTTSSDGIEDPSILSSRIINKKKSFRVKKYTHVQLSGADSFCPREYTIGFFSGAKPESYVDFQMQQQFDIGSAMHWWYQNRSKVFRNVLNGFWFCLACKQTRMNKYGTRYFGTKPNTPCLSCGADSDATEYQEFMFRLDAPYRVVGKLDAVMSVENVFRLADFKSFWEKPDSGFPIGKDVVQLSCYQFFYNFVPEEEKFPVPIDTKGSYLYYISKKFSYKDSILTYLVEHNDKLLEAIKTRIKAFTDGVNGGAIPDPFDFCIGSNFKTGRAKDCALKDMCHSLYRDNVKAYSL
jgi:hypothetical protein